LLNSKHHGLLSTYKGSSSFNAAIYWEPVGNGERFVVLRSTPATGRDNRINVMVNWQAGLN
jgi:hypothetical protein